MGNWSIGKYKSWECVAIHLTLSKNVTCWGSSPLPCEQIRLLRLSEIKRIGPWSNRTDSHIKRREDTSAFFLPCENTEESGCLWTQKQVLTVPDQRAPHIRFLASELQYNKFVLLKPCNIWYFVKAAQMTNTHGMGKINNGWKVSGWCLYREVDYGKGIIPLPKDVSILIFETFQYVNLHGKRYSTDVIKLKT
jgi:hypothetical protein